jgi:hypothetical protein
MFHITKALGSSENSLKLRFLIERLDFLNTTSWDTSKISKYKGPLETLYLKDVMILYIFVATYQYWLDLKELDMGLLFWQFGTGRHNAHEQNVLFHSDL